MICGSCGYRAIPALSKFCNHCGAEIPAIELLQYSGMSHDRGLFRVTFPPQEEEFDCEDEARDAVRHSSWCEDYEFKGEVEIEFVRSTTTSETHPYICGTCGEMVSETDNLRCNGCGEVNWVKRSTLTE